MKGQEVKTLDERADERRDFDGGVPARRSRDGNGKTAAPVGPMTGRAVSPQAKCDRTGARAGGVPFG